MSSMFTKILVKQSVDITVWHLQHHNLDPNIINEFKYLVTLCMSDNLCVLKGKTSLPMGGLLSSLVADVFMDQLKTEILTLNHHSRNIHFQARHVDDISCVWRGPDHEFQTFLRALNGYLPSINFTMEVDGHTWNYSDLIISSEEHADVLHSSFCIYHQSTFSRTSIHGTLYHPRCRKLAAINSAIHHLLSLPVEPNAFEAEINPIEHIAKMNDLQINACVHSSSEKSFENF